MITLVALWYGEENWRGSRAWNKYRSELEARGEVTDFQVLIPKPVPEADNFAATPLIQSWFSHSAQSSEGGDERGLFARAYRRIGETEARNKDRHFADLVA